MYPETVEAYGKPDIKGLFEKTTPFSIKAIQLLQKRLDQKDIFDPNKYLSYITDQGIGYYRKKDGTNAKIYEYEQVQTNKTNQRIASIAEGSGELKINQRQLPLRIDIPKANLKALELCTSIDQANLNAVVLITLIH
jgi:hypothetical protein